MYFHRRFQFSSLSDIGSLGVVGGPPSHRGAVTIFGDTSSGSANSVDEIEMRPQRAGGRAGGGGAASDAATSLRRRLETAI